MPFVEVTANIAIAKKLDFRHENLVMIKPTAAKVSIYGDAARTKKIASCPAGETTLKISKNPELVGEFWMDSTIDAQTVTLNFW